MTRYADDHDGYCDMRADEEELRRSEIEFAASCDACFELTCTCPTLPIDHEDEPMREPVYGMCTGCGSVEVRLDNPTGTRNLSGMGEHHAYPTGYGCEVCS